MNKRGCWVCYGFRAALGLSLAAWVAALVAAGVLGRML